jgi:hypothetical protein
LSALTVPAFGIGAALLAMWLTVRFPKLAPSRGLVIVLHLLLASLVAQIGVPAGIGYIGGPTRVSLLSALLLVALPGLVYVFLSAMWLIQWAQRKLTGGGPSGGLLTRV